MDDLLELLAHLDLIDRIEGFISTFINADWRGAYERHSVLGLVGEFLASLLGLNRRRFYIPRNCGWRGIDIERLLRRHGVKTWGRGFTRDSLYFYVKLRQANWAEYLLLRRGIPVHSPDINPLNRVYARWYAPGDEPPFRSEPKPGFMERLLSLLLE